MTGYTSDFGEACEKRPLIRLNPGMAADVEDGENGDAGQEGSLTSHLFLSFSFALFHFLTLLVSILCMSFDFFFVGQYK